MNLEDMILVSVDDHVIEPGDMFEGRLPAKYQDKAPKLDPPRRRDRLLALRRATRSPTSGSTRWSGRPPEEYGIEPTSPRRHAGRAATTSHERVQGHVRQRRARARCASPPSPSSAASSSPAATDKDRGAGHGAGLQRLAHRRVVRGRPRPVHPPVHPVDVGPRARGRRGAPRGQEGLPRRDLLREPRQARAAQHCTASTGTRSGRPAPTRARSSACTSGSIVAIRR